MKNQAKDLMIALAEDSMIKRYTDCKHPSCYKPGEIYNNLGPIKKHVLKDLKSEDIANIRIPNWLR